ncbi:MAG: S8 family serine peptidase [Candidatus Sulfotelmatobacter sp.]
MLNSPHVKLDIALDAAWSAWEKEPDISPNAGISVNLRFVNDLSEIEALGFETHSVFGDQALGVVRFKDIPRLTEHPNVVWISAGGRHRAHLDRAVRDIRARATAPISGAPVDGIWAADVSSGALTSIPKATGKGVIVAIMDTGIDYTHPMFLSQISPTKKTRILKIWDQGLTPSAVTDCPDKSLLASADTYGVEFDSTKIEAALNGGTDLDHKDCEGHGTHVAGIAAGGTLFTPIFGDATLVGVAPEADIIAVKFLDNPDKIFYRLADNSTGAEISWTSRFRDGLLYCLRTARTMDRPVVVNMSFGDDALPGDGLDDDARWVDGLLDPAAAAGDNNFPKGAIVVKSAGNEPGGDQISGQITVPPSGEIVVPLALLDARDKSETTWENCAETLYTPNITANFWYRRPSAPLSVQFAIRFPYGSGFSADVSAGGSLALGLNAVQGPPPNDIFVATAQNVHRVTIEHKNVPAVPHPDGGTVQRQYVSISMGPKINAGTFSYHARDLNLGAHPAQADGIYEARIRAPQGTVFYFKGFDPNDGSWSGGVMVFRLFDTLQNGQPRDSINITSTTQQSIFDPLGQHVITVAAYDDVPRDPLFDSPTPHSIAYFSSRGPLRDFSDPASPLRVFPKPDIAAPGVDINSAYGRSSKSIGLHWPWWYSGVRFQTMSGTSMSAPMIAGAVALMLEKNANLTATDIRTHLSATPRPGTEPPSPPASTNAYGVGMVDVMSAHNDVP